MMECYFRQNSEQKEAVKGGFHITFFKKKHIRASKGNRKLYSSIDSLIKY
jgi:hypothetical protein